jgi:hypothetical protein
MGAVLAVAGGATAASPLRYGVSDDAPKFEACGNVFWQSMNDIGFRELRMTVQWTGASAIPYQANIQAAVDCALLNNVTPVLAIYADKAAAIGSNDSAQTSFASFVSLVGQAFPRVQNFIIGNEPNQNRFWQPQFVNGQDAAGQDYEHTLAKSYDALKLVRPDSIVWGPAISSRGNDNASAPTSQSHSPVRFIAAMGAAYRASGRTKPIFDEYDMHPYPPNVNTDPYTKQSQWPNAGAGNLDRIKQALWDAFNGTGQPTPAEQSNGRTTQSAQFGGLGLPMNLDEVGTQTVIAGHDSAYTDPPDNVPLTTEAQQAQYYTDLMELAACDPDVKSLLFFPLIDNTDVKAGFQSGLLFADNVHKVSYGAVKTKIASSQGMCQGGVPGIAQGWQHTTQVVGAAASFGGPGTVAGSQRKSGPGHASMISATANEDANYKAGIFPLSAGSTAAITRALSSARTGAVASISGIVQAYHHPPLTFKGAKLPAGTYVYGIRLTAVLNPTRSTTLVSKAFTVGPPTTGKGQGAGKGGKGGKGSGKGKNQHKPAKKK